MANKQISDLRHILFVTMHRLLNKEEPMNPEQASAIAHVAQTVINTAKVEIEFMETVGGSGTGFIPNEKLTQTTQSPLELEAVNSTEENFN